MPDELGWQDRARCRGMDPELFFPAGEDSPHWTGAVDERAVAACRACDVRADCLDWALRHERHGYWAGTSERQRRRLRRQLAITVADPPDPTLHPTADDPVDDVDLDPTEGH